MASFLERTFEAWHPKKRARLRIEIKDSNQESQSTHDVFRVVQRCLVGHLSVGPVDESAKFTNEKKNSCREANHIGKPKNGNWKP